MQLDNRDDHRFGAAGERAKIFQLPHLTNEVKRLVGRSLFLEFFSRIFIAHRYASRSACSATE